jgi:hypothetical protein
MACFVSATKAISRGNLGEREHGFIKLIKLINLGEGRRIHNLGIVDGQTETIAAVGPPCPHQKLTSIITMVSKGEDSGCLARVEPVRRVVDSTRRECDEYEDRGVLDGIYVMPWLKMRERRQWIARNGGYG